MSNTYRKVDYECYCGQDYGSCKSPGTFYLKYVGVSNHFVVFQRRHKDEPLELIARFGDEDLHALGMLITKADDELDGCTAEEVAEINKQQS